MEFWQVRALDAVVAMPRQTLTRGRAVESTCALATPGEKQEKVEHQTVTLHKTGLE